MSVIDAGIARTATVRPDLTTSRRRWSRRNNRIVALEGGEGGRWAGAEK
jgi:hypothetical protein